MADQELEVATAETEEPKPRTRTRRTTKKAVETVEDSAAKAPEAEVEAGEKPARRTRKKAVAKDAEADAAPSEEAVAPKPTRRRTKVKATAEEPPAEAVAEVAAEAKPARRTRAKAQPKPEPKPEAAPEAAQPAEAPAGGAPVPAQEAKGESEAAEPAEKPRRRTRRVRVEASEPAEAAGAPNGEAKAAGAETAGSAEATPQDVKAEERTRSQKQPDRQQRNSQNNQARNNRHNRRQRNNREIEPSVTREELAELKVAELRERATALGLDVTGLKKAELVEAVFTASVRAEGFVDVAGVLDILSDGYGFLRTTGYLPGETDCYVGTALIKRNGLRKGDYVEGTTRPARENEKFAAIQKINRVNGLPVEQLALRPRFADLTPIYPSERLVMEHGKSTTTARVIDLVAPIGKGQRGLIVSPPKAGKTTILKDIAASISANNPEVYLMCLLVDERPEEVTDMQRSIRGEVISSTFDMPADNHIAVAEMVIERAKRLVEIGKDVVILLDSITRLARAYNLAQPASGRVLSGGVDSTALYPPKRFLGAARNIEHGGSLTILASALIETGSKMDEVIFEEFKGTGNMELRLDRQLADRRFFPAIDPVASGTRKEELLLDSQMAPLIWAVRRLLANMNNTERAMDMLIKSIRQTEDNNEFLLRTARKAQHSKAETFEL